MRGEIIVAPASPPGRGAVSLLRLSGRGLLALAQVLCPGPPAWVPRRASLRRLRDAAGLVLDEALVVFMPGPRSFTGEDVLEIALHGNPLLVAALQERCVELGARPARPGEFTRRSLENGRMDLISAEALSGLIAANSPAGIAAARAGLEGRLQAQLAPFRERLLDHAAELEARLDYPGEDLTLAEDPALCASLLALAAEARGLAETWTWARRRLHGARIALVGPVNAGKSSLFNALLGERRALVSPEPGTTRDVVERRFLLGGLSVELLDTAGERPEAEGLEAQGIALGRELSAEVDLRLLVLSPEDVPETLSAYLSGPPTLLVLSRCPTGGPAQVGPFSTWAWVDSPSGAGIPELRERLGRYLAGPEGQATQALSERQHAHLLALADHAEEAAHALSGWAGPAVAAESVVAALENLSDLLGGDAREDVLDRLFSRFCIGK
jgi:tRNA modification GTPase